MNLTLKEIAGIVNGKLIGQENCVIVGVSTIQDAMVGFITFLGNKKYTHFLKDTKASAIFVSEDINVDEYKDKNLIIVKDPQLAFSKMLVIIDKQRLDKIKPGVSPKATLEETVILGKDVTIGHNVVVEDHTVIGDNTKILANTFVGSDVVIGKNCLIYPNVTIREKTIIGDNCIIHPGVVIGGDGFGFAATGEKIPQIGHVEIGNNVEIGANTTIDRAAIGKTSIGNNTKIDNLVMIAHNVQVGENTIIVSQVGIAGSTKIGNKVTLGGQVGVVGHITVGDNVMVGAKSGINGNLKENQIVAGYPLQPFRKHLESLALIKRLPEMFANIKKILKKLNIEE
ncbi:MAG: UDP-3-O-(3-hydroxymyristoyl)glucosamine N-acyltransferase [Endomicrobiaceae bacterium]|nr:UDP-3-O-(3-hydroxymyristoyl)glucosamine N-acyltransferase [Endomicrobiaceae bacterium]